MGHRNRVFVVAHQVGHVDRLGARRVEQVGHILRLVFVARRARPSRVALAHLEQLFLRPTQHLQTLVVLLFQVIDLTDQIAHRGIIAGLELTVVFRQTLDCLLQEVDLTEKALDLLLLVCTLGCSLLELFVLN